jgi:transcriptional regulator with XRE-family HTH domain
MNDSDESDKSPATHRRPSVEICYRLADNLRRYRHYRGYTQHELARQCGFSNSYIGDVEQGTVNITLANLEAITNGLRCGEDELLRRHLLLPPFR